MIGVVWVTAGAVAALAAGGLVVWRRVRVLRRRMAAEELRGALMDGAACRDAEVLRARVEALRGRLVGAMAEQEALAVEGAALAEAERVVEAAYARYGAAGRRNGNEGGSR